MEFFRKMMKNYSQAANDRGIVQARRACETIDTDTCGDMHSGMLNMLGEMYTGMHNDHMSCNVTTCMTACTARCISTCMTPCTTTSPPACMKHVDRKPVMLQVKKVAESVARKKAMLRREGQARHACPQPPPVVVARCLAHRPHAHGGSAGGIAVLTRQRPRLSLPKLTPPPPPRRTGRTSPRAWCAGLPRRHDLLAQDGGQARIRGAGATPPHPIPPLGND